MSHRHDLTVVTIDRDDRRLVQQNSLVGLVDEGVDSAQIDSKLVLEELLNELHGDGSSSKLAGLMGASSHSQMATRMPDTKNLFSPGEVFVFYKRMINGRFPVAVRHLC